MFGGDGVIDVVDDVGGWVEYFVGFDFFYGLGDGFGVEGVVDFFEGVEFVVGGGEGLD